MMRLILTALILSPMLFLSACGKKSQQEDCGFVQNVYGERVSWKEELPVKLYVHQSYPQEYIPTLKDAIQDWEKVTGKHLFEISGIGKAGTPLPTQDGVNIISWVKEWNSGLPSDQAITAVFYVSDTMKEADMRINANKTYYTDSAQLSTFAANQSPIHLKSLLIHELGHVLGLKHNERTTATAMATTLPQKTDRGISEEDRQSVLCEY